MSFLPSFSVANSSIYTQHIPLLESSASKNNTNGWATQVISAFLLCLAIIKFTQKKYFNPADNNVIRKIPGPSGIPVLGNLIQIVTEKDILGRLASLAREYRPYYRLQVGPKPVIILTAPEAVEKLLSSNENGHIVKADEYAALADYWDEGLGTSCGDKWRARRKLLAPLFNYKCFPHFLDVFNRHSKILIEELDEMFRNDCGAKPIQNPLYESALKIISETAMGVELNDTTAEFDKFFDDAEKTKEFIWLKVIRPWYQIGWIWKFLPFRKVYEQNVKDIKDYIFKVIREARMKFQEAKETTNSGFRNKHKTVMDALLENDLSDSDIREEAHTGHETSAAALQFALMFLALFPQHQEECRREIDEIVRDEGKCPKGNFTLASLAELKYTERCLRETLRIYPIAYITGRKLQAPLKMDENITFPVGTTCVIIATDLHRNPEIYPEPEKFDPSRFTPENCATRHPYAYIPFSAGVRVCLGYKFAMAEMKLMLARILHHFTVSTTDRMEDVPMDSSIVITPVRGYNFILKRRNQESM